MSHCQRTIMYIDSEHIQDSDVQQFLGIFDPNIVSLICRDETLLDNDSQFMFTKIPGPRNYSVFRKDLDQYINQLFDKIYVRVGSTKLLLYPIIRYDLLFDLEQQFYKIWVISYILKNYSADYYRFSFNIQNLDDLIFCRKLKRSVERSNLRIKIDYKSEHSSIIIGFIREKIYHFKSSVLNLLRFGSNNIDLKTVKSIWLEGYKNSLKLSLSFFEKSGFKNSEVLYILKSHKLVKHLPRDLKFLVIDNLKPLVFLKSYLIQKRNKKRLNGEILHNANNFDSYQDIIGDHLAKYVIHRYDGLLRELISLVLIYQRILGKVNGDKKMISTNFVNMFSRTFCSLFPETSTVYLQHGLIPCHGFIYDIPQSKSFIWGKKYYDLIIDSDRTQTVPIILGDLRKKSTLYQPKQLKLLSSEIDFIYFASRPGGSNVSIALHWRILKMIEKLASNKPELSFVIKLHPSDRLNNKHLDGKNILIVMDVDAKDLMSRAKIISFTSSTTGLEALRFSSHILWINPIYPVFEDLIDFSKYDFPLIKCYEELEQVVAEIRNDLNLFRPNRSEIIKDYYQNIDVNVIKSELSEEFDC